MDAMLQTCSKMFNYILEPELVAPTQNQSIYDAISEISPNLDSVILFAYWTSNLTLTLKFKPILTEEGLCFTFNSLNSGEIFTDEWVFQLKKIDLNFFFQNCGFNFISELHLNCWQCMTIRVQRIGTLKMVINRRNIIHIRIACLGLISRTLCKYTHKLY